MKRFLPLVCALVLAALGLGAAFPYVTLNNKTNRLSDSGAALTYNGTVLVPAGTMVNSGVPAVGAVPAALDVTGTNWGPSSLVVSGTNASASGLLSAFKFNVTSNGTERIGTNGWLNGGFEGLHLPFDYGIRGDSATGTNYNLLRMAWVWGIQPDPLLAQFAVLGDSRMSWLSCATRLDLVGNDIIDCADVGNKFGNYTTRLVQGIGNADYYLGLATENGNPNSYSDRIVIGNHAYRPDVAITNANLVVYGALNAENLMVESEAMDLGPWAREGINAFGATDTGASGAGSFANTARTTDPIGGTTADFVQENASVGVPHRMIQTNFLATDSYVFKARLKAAGRSAIALTIEDQAGIYELTTFNLVAMTNSTPITGGTMSAVTASIADIGDGWALCTVNFTIGTAKIYFFELEMEATPGTRSYNGDNTSGMYLAMMELRRSCAPVDYITTTLIGIPGICGVAASTRGTVSILGSFAESLGVGPSVVLNATNDCYLVNTDAQTVTLPSASGRRGRKYEVKLISPAATGTLTNSGGEYIDGALSYSLSASNKFVVVRSDGTNWWIIGSN